MGIEVAIGAAVLSAGMGAYSARQSASAQMKANVKEAEQKADNLRRQASQRAANIQSGFLSSGLFLQGTPNSLVQQTYDVAQEDIRRTFENTRAGNRALATGARNSGIQSILSAGVSIAGLTAGAGATPTMGADAFGANTVARTTSSGIRLPAGLPKSTV